MAETKKVPVAKVERYGEAIIVPVKMTLDNAIKVLQARIESEEQIVKRYVDLDGHPYDVAYAFGLAIEKVCGMTLGQTTYTMWGPEPPKSINVEVEPGKYIPVLWGQILFPFDPKGGHFQPSYVGRSDGTIVGRCVGEFKQKYEKIWEDVVHETRAFLLTNSLYRGRTLRIEFMNKQGQLYPVPEVRPWDVSKANMTQLVFSKELEQSIEDHILTPIRDKEIIEAAGTPFKRGVLLAGPYGCGKTLLAAAVASEAHKKKMTVLYIENVLELPNAIRLAALWAGDAGAVVFSEDVDRVTDGERTHDVDVLLNTLDGIDTKRFPIMTILTSNYANKIYKGMVRPGRIDVALQIDPPDAFAAGRLVRKYLGDAADSSDPKFEAVGAALAGMIPAVIREIAERAKLSHISRTHRVPGPGTINAEDVLRATDSMRNQLDLLNAGEPPETFSNKLGKALAGLIQLGENGQIIVKTAELYQEHNL